MPDIDVYVAAKVTSYSMQTFGKSGGTTGMSAIASLTTRISGPAPLLKRHEPMAGVGKAKRGRERLGL